jgi:hypothetical protein
VLDDEVKAILRELLAATGCPAAAVAPANGESANGETAEGTKVAALGGGHELRLDVGEKDPNNVELSAAVEHAVRALRAAARRWESQLPPITIGTAPTTGHERATARIVAFLTALASVQHARNACVVVEHRIIAWAHPPEPLDEARWPLLERRAQAAAHPGESSHGELADADAYAVTFWYGAALIVYFAGPYGVDFVRHRARLVTREMTLLLPLLDPDPNAPAARLPVP